MSQKISRSRKEPIRESLSWEERWEGPDKGLILCWEIGRQLSQKEPELAERARNGELPVLVWKGGVEKEIKAKKKYGSHLYLAQWQGLRGEDLDIDLSQETELVCPKTKVKVVYTSDSEKYSEA